MSDEFSRVESIGLNCEVGFALKEIGRHEPGRFEPALLKWAFTPPDRVAPLIHADLADLYNPAAMIPCGPDVVLDSKYNIAFHSNIRSEFRDGAWHYLETDANKRLRILAAEQNLVNGQAAMFRKRFETPNTLYVLARHDDERPELTDEIVEAIKNRSSAVPFTVLEVRAASNKSDKDVVRVNAYLLRGHVDFFAPHDRVNEIDTEGWTRVLTRSLSLTSDAYA